MSMREAIERFREMHEEYKTGAFKSREALAFYESERDEFVMAVLQAQQIGLRPGQAVRHALRIAGAVGLELTVGPRKESATTIDVGTGGFAAVLGSPYAPGIRCEFQLELLSGKVQGRARLAAAVRDAASQYRTSFAIESMPEEDRKRLDIAVIDAALVTMNRR